MSNTAHFYRKMIQKQVVNLRSVKDRTGWGPAAKVKLEVSVVQAFYALSKLLSEELVPAGFVHLQVPLMAYPYKSDHLQMKHWRNWRKHYQMTEPVAQMHSPEFIAHQVVHNSLFDVDQDVDKRLASLYLTSAHQKHTALYQIGINELIELLEESTQL
jgi:hypothetical protein